jgi:hypothetical protein
LGLPMIASIFMHLPPCWAGNYPTARGLCVTYFSEPLPA